MRKGRPGSSRNIFLICATLVVLLPAFALVGTPAWADPGLADEGDGASAAPPDTADGPAGPPQEAPRSRPRPAEPRIYGDFGSTYGVQHGPMQFPPTVIGPGGVIPPPRPPSVAHRPPPAPKALTAEERAAKIRKALAPRPPLAVARRRTLDELYAKLAVAKDPDEAKGLASLIGNIWLRSGSDTANLLMQRALQAIEKHDYQVAADVLDRLIALKPSWAEAWNKRAAVRFYQGNFDGAMADVEHVLRLEPKHFGALDGMGSILQHTGFDKRALEVFRRSLEIYPQQPEIQKIVDKLQLQVEGQGI